MPRPSTAPRTVATDAPPRPLRADARRTVAAVLDAAERVLAADPQATLDQVATAAGVSRASIHRHFASREALLRELTHVAVERLADCVEQAHPETAPPLVALYQATYNVLQTKSAAPFTLAPGACPQPEDEARMVQVRQWCMTLLQRCREQGLVAADADLDWVRQVYYALLQQALRRSDALQAADDGAQGAGPTTLDSLATLVVDTLLQGAGPRSAPQEQTAR